MLAGARDGALVDAADGIWREMAGWPAGCSIAVHAGHAPNVGHASQQLAFDFLANEVLSGMPEALERFLTRCSILSALTPAACTAVSLDPASDRWLREIVRRGLFVAALSADGKTLRLHDLFRLFLRERLAEREPDAIPELFARAASVAADPLRKIHYFVDGHDLAGAERAFCNMAPQLLLKGDSGQLQRMIGLFPQDFVTASADLGFYAGLTASANSNWTAAQKDLARAEACYHATDRPERENRAKAHQIICFIGMSQRQEAARRHAELASEPLDPGTRALVSLAGYWLARVGGSVESELAAFDRLLEALSQSTEPTLWNDCALHIHLGGQRGMGARAERYAAMALAISEEGHDSLRDSARCMRAWHLLLNGDYEAAAELVYDIESNQAWLGKPHAVRTTIFVFKCLLALLERRLDDVMSFGMAHLREFDGREGLAWVYWRGTTLLLLGKLYIALEHWAGVEWVMAELGTSVRVAPVPILQAGLNYLDVALAFHRDGVLPLDASLEAMEKAVAVGDIVVLAPAIQALRALVLRQRGDLEGARQVASELVGPILANNEILQFQVLGDRNVKGLAEILRTDPDGRISANELLRLGGGALSGPRGGQAAIRLPHHSDLTGREIEILRLMAEGDANKIIARKLSISHHTVKRHVANILDKLALKSRGQAAAWLLRQDGR